jgi:long-chain acyl-CoA synthetase
VNLGELLDGALATVPDRTALIVGEQNVTYAELARTVDSIAALLSERGVAPGGRVALVDATSLLSVATLIACARIGAAAVPMSARSTASEIAVVARAAGCGTVAVAGDEAADRVFEALRESPIVEKGIQPARRVDAVPRSADDTAVVVLTSGTTGVPKPVPLTNGVIERRMSGYVAPPDPSVAAVAILCVPFHHVAGLVGVILGLAGGNTSVVQPRFDAGEWLELVERHRVQRAFLVPTMLRRILDHPRFADTDLSSLLMITYGAAPAPPELVARAVDALPNVAFIQVFGQTETLGAVTMLTPEDQRARPGSVGKPMPGVEIRIVDPTTGADVADGETGEFWARAPFATSAGWVHTGDLVRRDADGYLYAVGRMSDVINRGGEKIDPAEVEAALRKHASVMDAAVLGIADEDLGERVAAVVVARDLRAEDVREWCRGTLARFKVPERVIFVDELPLTELGKVSRKELRALFETAP